MGLLDELRPCILWLPGKWLPSFFLGITSPCVCTLNLIDLSAEPVEGRLRAKAADGGLNGGMFGIMRTIIMMAIENEL